MDKNGGGGTHGNPQGTQMVKSQVNVTRDGTPTTISGTGSTVGGTQRVLWGVTVPVQVHLTRDGIPTSLLPEEGSRRLPVAAAGAGVVEELAAVLEEASPASCVHS